VKYKFSKIAPTESTTTADQADVTAVDDLVLSQQDQPQIRRLTHQHGFFIFYSNPGLKCLKGQLLKN